MYLHNPIFLLTFTASKEKDNISMKTTIKFLDADLVNDITYLMVGIKQIEIAGQEYRMLVSLSSKWQSGLEKKRTSFKFIESNAIGEEGRAMASIIKKIINR